MFGYIKPYKPEMKVREFDTFKAIYCGLCKQLSHVFGPFASLTLSYDFTFMAAVSLSMRDECGGFKKCACVANPFKKKACAVASDDLTYCASAAMLMLYYKLKYDMADERFLKKARALLLFPFAALARKKARKLFPDADRTLYGMMQKQSALEKDGCTSIDRAADPTASALSVLCTVFSEDAQQKKVLSRFGYLIGRYVYFADAFDDLEKDEKQKSFNPFLAAYPNLSQQQRRIRAREVLNLTVGEIAPAYELLHIRRYKPILDNIIYDGFHDTIQSILQKKEKPDEKSI